MAARMTGVFLLLLIMGASLFLQVLRKRRPSMRRPGISSAFTRSGLILLAIGLILTGLPFSRSIAMVGVISYIIGFFIFLVQRRPQGA